MGQKSKYNKLKQNKFKYALSKLVKINDLLDKKIEDSKRRIV